MFKAGDKVRVLSDRWDISCPKGTETEVLRIQSHDRVRVRGLGGDKMDEVEVDFDKDELQLIGYETNNVNYVSFLPSTQDLIREECDSVRDLLLEKNLRYGDSALRKGSLFDVSPVIAIKARINDKLERLKNLKDDDTEDVTKDLIGYFILLRIAQKNEK